MYVPVPTQAEIIDLLKEFGLKGINYIEAMPDFRKCLFAANSKIRMQESYIFILTFAKTPYQASL